MTTCVQSIVFIHFWGADNENVLKLSGAYPHHIIGKGMFPQFPINSGILWFKLNIIKLVTNHFYPSGYVQFYFPSLKGLSASFCEGIRFDMRPTPTTAKSCTLKCCVQETSSSEGTECNLVEINGSFLANKTLFVFFRWFYTDILMWYCISANSANRCNVVNRAHGWNALDRCRTPCCRCPVQVMSRRKSPVTSIFCTSSAAAREEEWRLGSPCLLDHVVAVRQCNWLYKFLLINVSLNKLRQY